MSLLLDVSKTDDVAVVRCRGRIVFGEESDQLRALLLELLQETNRVILNMAWVAHIDSSGLGTLVASFISARHRGAQIKFASLSPVARQALTTTHVDQLFEIYNSTEAAVESFLVHPKAATR